MLGARMLLRMRDKLGRDGRHRDWEVLDTPAVASACRLHGVRFIYPNVLLRHEREMSTLAETVGRLALNQPRRVADLSCQRYEAPDLSTAARWLGSVRNIWNSCQKGELITSSKKKERTLAKELRDETRIKSNLNAATGLGKHRGTLFRDDEVRIVPGTGAQAVGREGKGKGRGFRGRGRGSAA